MHTIDTQAATQDSTTSTGAQATYNNWVSTGKKLPHAAYNPVNIRQMAPSEHTSDKQAYYSFINPGRMKGWVGLVGWPVAGGLPTIVVTRRLQAERRTGSVRWPKTGVLPTVLRNQPIGRSTRSNFPEVKSIVSVDSSRLSWFSWPSCDWSYMRHVVCITRCSAIA